MAGYSTIKKGSSGSSVEDLQKLLNQNGYSLDVDGIFGSKTQSAVRDYQQNNSLDVDGIVGNNTWNSLLGSGGVSGGMGQMGQANVSGSSSRSTAEWLAQYEGNRPTYTPSQAALDAQALLSQYEASRPGAYQSNYQAQIDGLLNKIMNREQFNYNFASDPIYQQMAENYTQQGKMAMMDTMGQAAALTGGYGSSYSQQVGQQAYNAYMQGLNDAVPQLRDAAYGQYVDEGNRMLTQMDVLNALENADYGRYRDSVSDYYNDLNYYYDRYRDAASQDYNMYLADLDAYEADRNYYYGKMIDEQSQENWLRDYEAAQAAASSRGSGRSSGGSSSAAASAQGSLADILAGMTQDEKSGNTAEEQMLYIPLYEDYEGNIGEVRSALKIMKNHGESDAQLKNALDSMLMDNEIDTAEYGRLVSEFGLKTQYKSFIADSLNQWRK